MAFRRRAGVSRPVARRRAPSTWARLSPASGTVIPAGVKTLLQTIILSNPGIGETVRRTRGLITILSDQESVVEHVTGAIGFVVVSDLALAAGAASIPGPVTDANDDGWFVWEPVSGTTDSDLTSTGTNQPALRFAFDSKAMRRVEEGSGIAIMVENASGVHGLLAMVQFSLLTSLS